MMKQETATLDCPKSMVGRVIGKNGETIKALQTYTGALIQIDQTCEPTKVTISGVPHSLQLAVSMVTDIMKGTFKGFALLRTLPGGPNAPVGPNGVLQQRPVYAPGYGLIPPSQLYGPNDRMAGPMHDKQRGMGAGWVPGQAGPSQMILGMQHMRPMGGGMMTPGMADETGMMMGYAPIGMAPLYGYPADYGMGGMVQRDMVYQQAPMGMASGVAGIGSSARMYQAAGARAGGGMGGGYVGGGSSYMGGPGAMDGGLQGARGSNFMAAAAGGGADVDAPRGAAGGGGGGGLAASSGATWMPAMDANGAMMYMPQEGVGGILQQQG